MADGQAQPLTVAQIESIRAEWAADSRVAEEVADVLTLPAGFTLTAQGPQHRAIGALLATLDAWRPVMEAMAALDDCVNEEDGYVHCAACDAEIPTLTDRTITHRDDCPVMVARRLLGMDA